MSDIIKVLAQDNSKAELVCIIVSKHKGGDALLNCIKEMLPTMRGSTLASFYYNDCNCNTSKFMSGIVDKCLGVWHE